MPMDPQRRQELEKRMNAPFIPDDRGVDPITMEAGAREWYALQSYSGALSLNRLFLRGQRNCSIYHWGPLDPESGALVSGLFSLHDYGLLTYESQPFEIKPQFIERGGGWWSQRRQRPYLSFLLPQNDRIPKNSIENFCTFLLAHPKIVTIINQRGKPFRTSMLDHHIVTKERVALSIKELYAEPFDPFSIVPREEKDESYEWGVEAIIRARCLDIQVASRSWDENVDLMNLVEGVAEAAGIGRVYAESS